MGKGESKDLGVLVTLGEQLWRGTFFFSGVITLLRTEDMYCSPAVQLVGISGALDSAIGLSAYRLIALSGLSPTALFVELSPTAKLLAGVTLQLLARYHDNNNNNPSESFSQLLYGFLGLNGPLDLQEVLFYSYSTSISIPVASQSPHSHTHTLTHRSSSAAALPFDPAHRASTLPSSLVLERSRDRSYQLFRMEIVEVLMTQSAQLREARNLSNEVYDRQIRENVSSLRHVISTKGLGAFASNDSLLDVSSNLFLQNQR